MTYLHIQFDTPTSNCSLDAVIKAMVNKAYRFYAVAMLFFLFVQKHLNKSSTFFPVYTTIQDIRALLFKWLKFRSQLRYSHDRYADGSKSERTKIALLPVACSSYQISWEYVDRSRNVFIGSVQAHRHDTMSLFFLIKYKEHVKCLL
jgi:peptidase E